MRVAVIGVGLIGGSVALAARARAGAMVTGADTPQVLAEATARGAIDRAAETVEEAVGDAEAVFVAAPVGALPELVRAVLRAAPVDCVVSDVGSVKRALVAGIEDPRFVGGHPLAGAETAGVAHARADLFEGATWYLTPRPATSGVLYERLHRLLHALGARPSAIDPATHDRVLAAVSHLPHVLANVLVAQAAATLTVGEQPLPATGPSFRDATRVAGAPSAIWTDIYLHNREAIIAEIDGVLERLRDARERLLAADAGAVSAWNDDAASDRRRLLERELVGGALFELRISVPNRPGVIAELALELGRVAVNIADMALYPASDMREGVIALWIAGSAEAQRAQELIAGLGFPVASP
ncbi:MAG: prephenate dehydrogenase/arogenate dehydrogenase family protein [Solirubrobacterales bacterium]|nr:prephenate dehydrogenase/arogenate dehydrogenase family protein [Solirubrobacterales bacterium]